MNNPAANDQNQLPEIPNSPNIPDRDIETFLKEMCKDLDLPEGLFKRPSASPVVLILIRLYQQNLVLEKELEDFKASMSY